jgi:hypothetical protein
MLAARGGHAAVVRFLLVEVGIALAGGKEKACQGTALHAACRGGHANAVRVLLELGAKTDVRVRRRLVIPETGDPWGDLAVGVTALREAALAGSLSCVRALVEHEPATINDGRAVSLAALGGHCDVVRALVQARPGADVSEAFSVAFAKSDGVMLRMLGDSNFTWSKLVISTLRALPTAAMERVCKAFGLMRVDEKSAKWWCGGEAVLWAGLCAIVETGMATREEVERVLCVCWDWLAEQRSLRREVLRPLWALEVRASEVFDPCRSLCGKALTVLKLVLGDLSQCERDLYVWVEPGLIPRLLRENVPLGWGQYEDGNEYLTVLSRRVTATETVEAIIEHARAQKLDMSRHHYRSGALKHRCGYYPPGSFRQFLEGALATPCTC